MLADRARCPSCGTVPSEWLDEKGRNLDPPPYQAVAMLCVGCAVISEERKAIPDDKSLEYHVFLQKWAERKRG